jgi:hypothetical protein
VHRVHCLLPIEDNRCARNDKRSADQYASRGNVPKEEKIHYLERDEQGGEIDSRHRREFDWSKI